jgi:glycosyltransferase involved in cell wall biosynthesis
MFALCIVIPVYNHEGAIGAVVERVRSHGAPIFLVDDGSDPACAAELQRLSAQPNVKLLKHAVNRGKGAAVCTGMRAASGEGFTHALQVDADGQHTLEDIGRFIDEARAHPAAVICGRPVFDASIPKVRYYGRYLTHGMVWLETLSFEIPDALCGFRIYPLGAVNALLAKRGVGERMDFDAEILVRLHWRDVPMRWIDTRVSYPLDGVSHFRLFFDNVLMTSLHVRLVVGMLMRLPLLLWRKIARQESRRTRSANA